MDKRNFLPRDLLLANQWSYLLFTTYSLSLSFLEAIVVSALARSYRDPTVLADLAGYRSSLVDVGAMALAAYWPYAISEQSRFDPAPTDSETITWSQFELMTNSCKWSQFELIVKF